MGQVVALPRAQLRDSSEPEHLPQYRRVQQHRLLVSWQTVDPRSDDALHSLRMLAELPTLRQHVGVLLRIERVASCPGDELLTVLGRDRLVAEKGVEQPTRILVAQRRERQGYGVCLAAAPARPPLQ